MQITPLKKNILELDEIEYYFKLYFNGVNYVVVKEYHIRNTGYGEAEYFDNIDDALLSYDLELRNIELVIAEEKENKMEVYIL